MDARILSRQLARLRPALLSLQDVVTGAVLLLLVAIVATLVLVGYPRPWWTHSTFDVDEYIADDLVPRINRNVDALLALKLIGTDGGHEARGMVVSDDGSLSFPGAALSKDDGKLRSATAEAYDLLSNRCQSLRHLVPESYDRSDFTSGLADLGDAVSVRNSRPHSYNLLITQAADVCESLAKTVCGTYAGFLLLLGTDDMRNLQLGNVNVGLAELARTYTKALGPVARDPYLSHIGHCVGAKELGLEEHRVISTRIASAVLALTDLGYIYNVVVPQVRSMRYARRAKGFSNVFWLFFNPYRSQWFDKQAELAGRFDLKKGGLRQADYAHGIQTIISQIRASIFR